MSKIDHFTLISGIVASALAYHTSGSEFDSHLCLIFMWILHKYLVKIKIKNKKTN